LESGRIAPIAFQLSKIALSVDCSWFCDQNQVNEVVEAVTKLSRTEEFEFEVLGQREQSFFTWNVSPLLSAFKFKILKIPHFVGVLKDDSLKILELPLSFMFSACGSKFILADNPNLDTLILSDASSAQSSTPYDSRIQVSQCLVQLSVNQRLTTLKLSRIKLHDKSNQIKI
jgi:hypothetical protein